jgi:aquaporin Z
MLAQLVAGVAAAAVLLVIVQGSPAYSLADSGLAQNGFGPASPGGYSLSAALLTETLLTAAFLIVIVGATCRGVPLGFAPIAIGLALTLIHLISIPVTNTSVNPARSTGPAVIVGGLALAQLWLFWVAPLVGGAIGGLAGRWLFAEEDRAPAAKA